MEAQNRRIDEVQRKVDRLKAELAELDKQDRLHEEKIAADKSWWTYFSWLGGHRWLSEEEKIHMESKKMQRTAVRRIKYSMLQKIVRQLVELRSEKENRQRKEDERVYKEFVRTRAREAEVQEQQLRERLAREEKEKRARKERERQEREERERRAREERERRERERAEAERVRRATEALNMARMRFNNRGSRASYTSSCRHNVWWDKIYGQQKCLHCEQTLYKFLYECPKCKTTGCASCMNRLKRGEKPDHTTPYSSPENDGYRYDDW